MSGKGGHLPVAILVIFVACQILATSVHAVDMPDSPIDAQGQSEYPMHEDSAEGTGQHDACECIDGSCCDGCTHRLVAQIDCGPLLQAAAQSVTDVLPVREFTLPDRLDSCAQSRAPPWL
jgi:hypothetical protein